MRGSREFFQRGSTLTTVGLFLSFFMKGREDPNTSKSGPSLARRRNAIRIHWLITKLPSSLKYLAIIDPPTWRVAVKLNFRPYIRRYLSSNDKFEYSYPSITFFFKTKYIYNLCEKINWTFHKDFDVFIMPGEICSLFIFTSWFIKRANANGSMTLRRCLAFHSYQQISRSLQH